MMIYTSVTTSGIVTLIVPGKAPIQVTKDSPNYTAVCEAISSGCRDAKEFQKLTKVDLGIDIPEVVVEDNNVLFNGTRIPVNVHAQIMACKDLGVDITRFGEFFKRLAKNPIDGIADRLFSFLDAGNFPINEDGTFIGYKAVRDDYYDKHSNTKDNTPGNVVKESNFDTDPSRECSSGIHVGTYNYALGFANPGDKIVSVMVAPEHVISVPYADSTKLRCREYKVLADCSQEYSSPTATVTTVVAMEEIKVNNQHSHRDPITMAFVALGTFTATVLNDFKLGESRGSKEAREKLASVGTIKPKKMSLSQQDRRTPYLEGYFTGWNTIASTQVMLKDATKV